MVQGNINLLMVQNLKVFFKKAKKKVTEYRNNLIESFTKACGGQITWMEKANISGQTVLILKACSRMIKKMEKEHYSGQTVLIIKACGGKISLKVKAR
jgi:hypothetical protein